MADTQDTPQEHSALRWDAGKTTSGKKLVVVPNGMGLYRVEMTTGGQLPAGLKGLFTDPQTAQNHVTQYLVNKEYSKKLKEADKAEKDSNAKKPTRSTRSKSK